MIANLVLVVGYFNFSASMCCQQQQHENIEPNNKTLPILEFFDPSQLLLLPILTQVSPHVHVHVSTRLNLQMSINKQFLIRHSHSGEATNDEEKSSTLIHDVQFLMGVLHVSVK